MPSIFEFVVFISGILLTPKAVITVVTKMVYPRRRNQPHQVLSDLTQSSHLKSETKRKKTKYLKKKKSCYSDKISFEGLVRIDQAAQLSIFITFSFTVFSG